VILARHVGHKIFIFECLPRRKVHCVTSIINDRESTRFKIS